MQYFGRANRSRLVEVFVLAFAMFVFTQASYAQATSGVTGVVSDPTGKVVPGATVTLTDTKTERVLTTTTNNEGSYSFNNVAPGEAYKLTFASAGFQTLALSNVTLGVAKVETYDATLTAGDVSATVDVVAESSGDTLNTTDASIGNVIDTRQLRELPIQIRASPAALIGLQPGVVGNSVGTTTTNRVGSVTGSRSDQGNITIDGFDANDQATGQFAATTGNAPIDSVQEFRAISTNPNASEGRSAGGQVQIVTRSGSNDFHGSLREYHRNEDFAANSFFANRAGTYTAQDEALSGGSLVAGTEKQPRPHLVRNQFGGSLGGPLPFLRFGEVSRDTPYWKSGKDRLFFFFDYEGRRDARGIPSTRVVPLDHVRAGQVAYINNTPGCASSSRLNTTPQCITVLSQAGVAAIDPLNIGANSALLSYINGRYPRANDLSLGDGINTGGFRFNAASQRADDTYTTRFDANINDSHKLFVRLSIARGDQDDIVNSVAQQFPGDPRTALIVTRDYLLGGAWSWVVTPNLVNQLSIGNAHSGLDFPNLLDPLSPNVWNFQFTPATCTVCVTDPWASISEQKRTIDTPTFRDDATWTTGSHTFQFGGQWKPIRSVTSIRSDFNFISVGLGGNRNALGTATRPTNILSTTTAINAWDRYFPFALGRIGAVSTNFNYTLDGQPLDLASGKTRDFRYNEYELYLQDNWKITRSLTLNLGVRWHYYEPPYEVNGLQTTHDVDYQELFDIRVANGAAGIGGDDAEPLLTYDIAGKANDRPGFYKGDWNNFSPRVGFAYAPSFTGGIGGWLFGDRKTSIRGGYNLQYERVGGGLTFLQDQFSFLFDNTAATNFGGAGASNVDLALDPRFTSINSIPVTNIAPVITRPLTPFVDDGVPFGNAEGQVNYTISNTFEVPYYHQYSIGFQRELPGNFLIDVSYVGRLGRKLFTQVDAAQIVDFKDPVSGQTLLGAFNNVQAQVNAGTGVPSSVTAQAFFENQGALAIGAPCTSINWNNIFPGQGITNCTQAAVAVVGGSLFAIGDASDTVQALNAFGTLRSNVGLSGQFSTNSYVANLGRSRYDGLLISVQKRFSNGFQFDANYTYSFAKDNNSSVANTAFGGLVCDLRDLNVCYGPSDFDIRHIANFNGIWELPFGRGKWLGGDASGWVDQLIGGFQLSGIFTYRSGLPFSTTTGSFPVGFVYDSPAVFNGGVSVNGNIDPSGAAVGFFGNTDQTNAVLDSFRNPVGGEIGQRNNLRGPSFWNLDLGLAKSFRMPWEGHRLQLRADAFNVFNRNVFGLPNANINSAGFGQITTSATTPREIQFAIRYDF